LWRRDEAAASQRKAVELLEQLVQELPVRADFRLALARAYLRYFTNPRDAEKFRQEGLAILSDLAAEFPDVPDYQCELSEALVMPRFRSQEGDEETLLRQAVAMAENIAEKYSTIPRYRATQARTLRRYASWLQESERFEEAERTYSKAVGIYRTLHAEFPMVAAYGFFLARTLHGHGDTLRQLTRLVESRRQIEQAVWHQQWFIDSHRPDAFSRSALASQYESLSETLSLLGLEQESIAAAEKSEKIRAELRRTFRNWPAGGAKPGDERQQPSGEMKAPSD
jgi:tetratricopeptide (TPR) repeat protein